MATFLGDGDSDSLIGGNEDDSLDGAGDDDSLHGGKGNDSLRGGGGDDLLDGGAGNDLAIFSGSFALYSVTYDGALGAYVVTDSVAGRDGRDIVTGVESFQFADGVKTASQLLVGAGGGTAGNDILTGNSGNDLLQGLDGFDQLNGGAGNDTLQGGGGDDDILIGGAGNDTLDGGAGTRDTADFSGAPGPVTASLVSGLAVGDGSDVLVNIEFLIGGAFGDALTGDNGNNTLTGLAGDDSLHGGGGFDVLDGGPGNDLLDGGDGLDQANYFASTHAVDADLARGTSVGDGTDAFISIESITGSPFADTIAGDDGSNFLQGLGGDDLILGRGGNDDLRAGQGNDTLVGGPGDDFLQSETRSAIAVYTGNRDQYVITAKGSDFLVTDTVINRDGTDTVSNLRALQFADQTVTLVAIAPPPAPAPPPPPPPAPPSPNGTDGNDFLAGGSGPDSLHGGKGNDTLNGNAGNDFLSGDEDNDVLNGGDGDDTLSGGQGNDVLNGGNGVDTASYQEAALPISVSLQITTPQDTLGRGIDTLTSIENLLGSFNDDHLIGNALVNVLNGGGGSDVLDGGSGADQLIGGLGDDTYLVNDAAALVNEQPGEGTDTVIAGVTYALAPNVENLTLSSTAPVTNGSGNALDNVITGNALNNILAGAGEDDTLMGGSGDDVLTGSAGNDTLNGGTGSDIASYASIRAQYSWIPSAVGFTLVDLKGGDGTDILLGIERLKFSDVNLALDIAGHAGTVARILGAVFGPSAVSNPALVGVGLRLLDAGTNELELMGLALAARLGNAQSNENVVDVLYANLVGAAPSADIRAVYVAMIEHGGFTQASLGLMAANLGLNADNIHLVGLASSGLAYT